MPGDDPCSFDARELLAAYRARTLSPVEVLSTLFNRLDAVNPLLNAFYDVDQLGALEQAKASEKRWQRGEPKGRLDGVPVSVKDHLHVKGFSSPRGAFFARRDPCESDCPAAARLREAGAILFGKTNMPELSVMSITDSIAFGPTRHPLDLSKSAGGSSGGAAAAVAASLGPLALATDGGGSIRVPAALNGLVGLKPTHGLVPYFPRPTDRTVAGPIGKTVSDVALMLDVIGQPDGRDWMEVRSTGKKYSEDLGAALRPLKIAFSPTFGYQAVADSVRVAVDTMVESLSGRLGHRVEMLDYVCDDAQEVSFTQASIQLRMLYESLSEEDRRRFPPASRGLLNRALEVDAAAHCRAFQQRDRLATRLCEIFQQYDVIVSPTTPVDHIPIGAFYPDGDMFSAECRALAGFTRPFNIAHMPAISVPCGASPEGMPVGMQIAGPKHSESLLLRLATQIEALAPLVATAVPAAVHG